MEENRGVPLEMGREWRVGERGVVSARSRTQREAERGNMWATHDDSLHVDLQI